MYKFRRATENERQQLSGGTHNIYRYGNSDEQFALFLGKAITVFGQPDWIDTDYENMYSYLIVAENEEDKLYLEIYHGPGGSSIGGKSGEDYKTASEELSQLILSVEPSDYEWSGVYEDIPVNIKYTVKNGVVNIESEFADF